MTKLKLKLIRHGEKQLFLPNPGLTELGKNQAEDLAKKLASLTKAEQSQKTLLLASPLQRTQETAAIIAEQVRLPVVTDQFLAFDQHIEPNPQGKQAIIKHFSDYFKNLGPEIEQNLGPEIEEGEILAVTHSQNIKNYWQVLAGPGKAIVDVYECGVWTINIEGQLDQTNSEINLDFEWTEGDLNP